MKFSKIFEKDIDLLKVKMFGNNQQSNPFGEKPSNAFGQAPNATSTTMFGQQSGQPDAFKSMTSTTSTFGSTPTPFGSSSSFGTGSSSFGQTSPPVLGGFGSTTPASTAFGSKASTQSGLGSNISGASAFGSTASAPMAFGSTTSTAFGSNTSAPMTFGSTTSTAFGSSTSAPITFGSTTSTVFGSKPAAGVKLGSTASAPSKWQTSKAPSIFRSTATNEGAFNSPAFPFCAGRAKPSASNATSVLFGGESNASKTFGSTNASSGTFGSSPSGFGSTTESSGFGSSSVSSTANESSKKDTKDQQNVFGSKQTLPLFESKTKSASNSTAMFGTTGNQPTGLFGKSTTEPKSISGESNTEQNLFGKSSTSQNPQIKKTYVKPKGVFGIKSDTKTSNEGLFGKGDPSGSTQGLFGKPALNSKPVVFGSTAADEDADPGVAVEEERENNSSPSRRMMIKRKPVGLFGKAVSSAIGTDIARRKTTEADKRALKPTSRRLSSEDISNSLSISCKPIPDEYNTKEILKRHFQRFGKVTRVFPNPKEQKAIIHFENHEAAAEAKRNGHELKPGLPKVTIFWRPSKKALKSTFSKDVSDELSSMAGADFDSAGPELPVRPKEGSSRRAITKASSERRMSPGPSARSTSPARKLKAGAGGKFLNTMATTAGEKYELLEAIDKQMKLDRGKQTGTELAQAAIIIGTCPDMCPEKERYVREDRRRLGLFEILPGTEHIPGKNPEADHARCIKEYSRSSADQEMPLAHELRPPHVLAMTMNYIVNNIMDEGHDGNWADWYEFVWSRTRGIRKDITQQQLCNETAVDLVEKCCRFHILCSGRLCEEDVMAFDEKINSENMTKCLQTLKEMYWDMEHKHEKLCQNEAEFRAYTVLMNLNEGDTLRAAQELRPDIRNSPEMKFVLEAYFALNSNNYVKFFKLVKKGSFLNSCIMHRYFNQVRSKALSTMLRSYKSPGKDMQFPIVDLCNQLGFEDASEVKDFCMQHGLSSDDDFIMFNKSHWIMPETAPESRRSLKLIEGKLDVSYGEVVNNGPLPENILHQPVSSFNSNHRYIGQNTQILQVQQNQGEETPTTDVDTTNEAAHPSKSSLDEAAGQDLKQTEEQKFPYTKQQMWDACKGYVKEVVDEMCLDLCTNLHKAVQTYLTIGQTNLTDIIEETTTNIAKEICEETLVEEQARDKAIQAQRQHQEKEESKEKATEDICDEIIDKFIESEVDATAKSEMELVEKTLKEESIERCSEAYMNNLFLNVTATEALHLCDEFYAKEVQERLEDIQEAEKSILLLRTDRFFKKWKNVYAGRVRLKYTMLNFPSAPPNIAPAEQLRQLMPNRAREDIVDGQMMINQQAKLTIHTGQVLMKAEEELHKRISLYNMERRLRHRKAYAPLDLARIVSRGITTKSSLHKVKAVYWKMLLCTPSPENVDEDTKILSEWLEAKFKKGLIPQSKKGKSKTLSLYSSTTEEDSREVKIGVCSQLVCGDCEGTPRELVQGISAIVLLLPSTSVNDTQDYWSIEHSRLMNLLESKPAFPATPLVVIYPDDADVTPAAVVANLQLDELVLDKAISCYTIKPFKSDVEDPICTNLLQSAVEWLVSQLPEQVHSHIVRRSVTDLLENGLSTYFYVPVYQNLAARHKKNLPYQMPDVLVGLYNSVIEHLTAMCTVSTLSHLSWPPIEFTKHNKDLPNIEWNSEEQLEVIKQTLQCMTLPDFELLWEDPGDWDSLEGDIYAYVDAIAEDSNYTQLLTRINQILRRSHREFESHQWGLASDPYHINLPWTDVIEACINHQLSNLQTILETEESAEPLKVYYWRGDLEKYEMPLIWREATRDESENDFVKMDIATSRASKRKHTKSGASGNLSKRKLQDVTAIDLNITDKSVIETLNTTHNLQQMVANEKLKSDEFDDFLLKAVQNGESEYDCLDDISAYIPTIPMTPRFTPNFTQQMKLRCSDSELHPNTPGAVNLNESYLPGNFYEPQNSNFEYKVQDADLNESLVKLQQNIVNNREADKLYEMRLQALLTE